MSPALYRDEVRHSSVGQEALTPRVPSPLRGRGEGVRAKKERPPGCAWARGLLIGGFRQCLEDGSSIRACQAQ